MLPEPTDEELLHLIDGLVWLISKRKDGDELKRKLEIQLFCCRSTHDALTKLRERTRAAVELSTDP